MARINWRYLIILGFLSDMPNPQYHDIQFGNKVSYADTVFLKALELPSLSVLNLSAGNFRAWSVDRRGFQKYRP
jgi:hypothetical protein